MKQGYYQIGEVSKITGISKDTLHFYNKIGLLVPDYVDAENQYRYYSRWNLWQLDIITTCRKLSIPLEKVKQILSFRDNERIINLLMEYREEALRLSAYYRQVADDILWYDGENRHIVSSMAMASSEVRKVWLEEETVIAGSVERDEESYHANMQEAAKDVLGQAGTIRRKYGYVLDPGQIGNGRVVKRREYLKMEDADYSCVAQENLLIIPAGMYAVFTLHIRHEEADFTPLTQWLCENGKAAELIFAEELGLQLFDYIKDYYCEVKVYLGE